MFPLIFLVLFDDNLFEQRFADNILPWINVGNISNRGSVVDVGKEVKWIKKLKKQQIET
jgi:hypothetical protein